MEQKKQGAAPSAENAGGLFYRPAYLLLVSTGTIFAAEFLVMLILSLFPEITDLQTATIDAVMLSLLVFPSLYLFLLKPLKLHITRRNEAEAEKDRLILELQKALEEVKTLRGIVPICAWCKRVRDDDGYWKQVEVYMQEHTGAEFSHGICPNCATTVEV